MKPQYFVLKRLFLMFSDFEKWKISLIHFLFPFQWFPKNHNISAQKKTPARRV